MTTLELTALSYVPMMLAASICWYRKPSITRPRFIRTRLGLTVEEIREQARKTVRLAPLMDLP